MKHLHKFERFRAWKLLINVLSAMAVTVILTWDLVGYFIILPFLFPWFIVIALIIINLMMEGYDTILKARAETYWKVH